MGKIVFVWLKLALGGLSIKIHMRRTSKTKENSGVCMCEEGVAVMRASLTR